MEIKSKLEIMKIEIMKMEIMKMEIKWKWKLNVNGN